MKEMKMLCEQLNAHLPCKSQEDMDALTKLLQENIDAYPERRIYWSREIYIDAGLNEDRCLNILIHSDKVMFIPSEDPVEHQGIVVRYKHEVSESPFVSDKEYLDRAIDFIVESLDADPGPICDVLHKVPKENELCASDCQNLDHFCVLRFLKYYKPSKKE